MNMLIKRGTAYVIDVLITLGVTAMYLFFAQNFYYDSATYMYGNFMVICALIAVLILLGYIPAKSNGQTIGKMIMKLRVVNKNGNPRTMWQSLLRECFLKYGFVYIFIPFVVLYTIYESFISKKFVIAYGHDMLLKTDVVKKEG
ncbi:MAG: RDD family protein [Erysipelotrichaceae bacterium]